MFIRRENLETILEQMSEKPPMENQEFHSLRSEIWEMAEEYENAFKEQAHCT